MNLKKETKLELIKCVIAVECGRCTSFRPGWWRRRVMCLWLLLLSSVNWDPVSVLGLTRELALQIGDGLQWVSEQALSCPSALPVLATPESALDPSSLRPILGQHSFFPNRVLSKPHRFNPMLSSYLASPPFLAFLLDLLAIVTY